MTQLHMSSELNTDQLRVYAGIAQSVEQLIRNEKVGGSIPLSGTNINQSSTSVR